MDQPSQKATKTPIVEILVGPIASGKSTYATTRAAQGAIIINDDAIVNAVHCNQYKLYNKQLKPLYKAVENTILQTALILGKDVVVDRPNYAYKTRSRYISIAKSLDVSVQIVQFPDLGAEIHVARRMSSDPRGCPAEWWMEAYTRHKALFEQPTAAEAPIRRM